MTSRPKNKDELIKWLDQNTMTSLHCSVSQINREGNALPIRGTLMKDVEKVITKVSGGGVYLKTIKADHASHIGMDYVKFADTRESWLSIESIDEDRFLFTDDCFAIFIIEDLKKQQQSIIRVLLYEYGNSIKDRPSVRGVLNGTVTDSFYDAALNQLTWDELMYCIKHERRKTSLKKLERQAKKLKEKADIHLPY